MTGLGDPKAMQTVRKGEKRTISETGRVRF
jgi:hypothetical protein